MIYDLSYRSTFGEPLPDGFSHEFVPLWQLTDEEKSSIASTTTQTVLAARSEGLVSDRTALRELRQSADVTGVWSNITDEDIENASAEPPQPQMTDESGNPIGEPPQPGATSEAAPDDENAPQSDEDDAAELGDEEALLRDEEEPDNDPNDNIAMLREEGDVGGLRVEPGHYNEGVETLADTQQPNVVKGYRLPTRKEYRLYARRQAMRIMTADSMPMREVDGITCIIETPKGHRRVGYGWSVQMPADYGYISGTNSAEGPMEQMDCYIGPQETSNRVWIIEQVEPDGKLFDEHKVMLGYGSRDDALNDYKAAFADGRGADRVGRVLAMSPASFKKWLANWRYGQRVPTKSKAQAA